MKFRLVIAVLAATVVGSIAAEGTFALAPPPPPPGHAVDMNLLRPSIATFPASPNRGVTALHAGHPCYGQTDNPHRSRHRPGYVTVRGRTVCPGHRASVTVDLYRYAFGSWYFRDRSSGSGAGKAVANAATRARCGRFLGRSYHTATGHAPVVTQNQNRIRADAGPPEPIALG
jgi:hypothetical protein